MQLTWHGTSAGDRERVAGALHVTNGDAAGGVLAATGLAGQVLAWVDALHEGPVPAGLDDAGLREVRARFLAGEAVAERDAVLRRLERRDRELDGNREGGYVLWFEADLYDQLQVAQILARLARLEVAAERVTLVCVGEYPGIAHFGGLGELGPPQLEGLLATAATPLTASALDLGTAAWAALRADHPGLLGEVAASRSPELRFLGEAFDRLSREYPSTRDGLSLTERRILAAAATAGTAPAGAVFARVGEREARPFLADLLCFRIMTRLARARTPLLATDPPTGQVTAATGLRLTPAGRRVLAGEADHVALNGVDRWVGGVHLHGPTARWRWDEGTESITRAPDSRAAAPPERGRRLGRMTAGDPPEFTLPG
jgi:hypothetical protein